jgi:hypothetical protein
MRARMLITITITITITTLSLRLRARTLNHALCPCAGRCLTSVALSSRSRVVGCWGLARSIDG